MTNRHPRPTNKESVLSLWRPVVGEPVVGVAKSVRDVLRSIIQ